jgi:hypothetical protein
VPDARSLADIITGRGARLQIGPAVYNPKDPFGKVFFNILAAFASSRWTSSGCARWRA